MFKKPVSKKQEKKPQGYEPKMFGNNNQVVNVSVTVEEDDGLADCLAGCFRMCLSAAKEAK